MTKKTIITMMLALVAMAGQAQGERIDTVIPEFLSNGYFLTSSLVRYFYLPHDGTYGFKGVSEDLTGDSG